MGHGRAVAVGLLLAVATAGAAAASQSQLSSQDQQFLRTVHQGNLAEIAVGRLAQSRGASEQVRSIGALFVADHTRLDGAVQQLASMNRVTLPEAPDAEQRAMQARLENASGSEFDRLFITGQLAAHSAVLRLGMTEEETGSSAEVKRAAADAAPVVRAHIDRLTAAARQLGVPISINTGSAGLAAASSRGWQVAILAVAGLVVAGLGGLGLRRRAGR
ncbi:DUF4142 domain-containing protein [Gandjariella thermophila]|uniref:DUF4142 domain-containing protein n=1 Tax=Gandjariella thermophila TaxID=1931992 RepID=A0A4D4JBI6_9PSEU|nr:DUF4142 domain-containing protein [Gandjariella thermophila]GDY31796.1 hypothetical protein GTS_34290 [Gandjariella thermophila]